MKRALPSSRDIALVVVLTLTTVLASGCVAAGDPSLDASPAGTRAFGERCIATEDCASALCLSVASDDAVCTRACDDDGDCPTGPSWGCISPEGFADRVCGCAASGDEEVCGDGLDNDCNGRADDCRTCDGVPVPEDDPRHCGGCGIACRSDQECSGGACRCPARVSECGGRCVDLANDRSACGACTNACPEGASCAEGSCACPGVTPDVCDARCTDLGSDRSNCGECGIVCGSGLSCEDGECRCDDPTRSLHCPGVGCVDRLTDRSNCGACGNICPAAQQCIAGACACPDPTQSFCDGACIDTQFDAANCGACGRTCAPGDVCQSSTCVCSSGLTCGGRCVETADPTNCGGCGVVCRDDQRCAPSIGCICSFPPDDCGTACVSLSSDRNNCGTCGNVCPAAQTCSGGTCACPTFGATYCAASGACVDLRSDHSNCGTCGNVCPAAQTCSSSSCRCPGSGQTYCDATAACVDLQNDAANCGSCGNVCPTSTTCRFGSCECPTSSQRYCAAIDACADVATDETNCGSCGNVCPAATTCLSHSCRCDTAGLSLCGTSCVDLRTDAAHCSRCDGACTAGLECRAGACVCPSATAGAPARLTEALGNTIRVAAATGTTHLGVVYEDARSSSSGEVYFRRVNLDGTPAGAELVLATSRARYPDIVWTGSEWGVVWRDDTIGDSIRLARIDADGALIGTIASIPCRHPLDTSFASGATSNPRVVWSATNGYAIVRSTRRGADYDIVFQVLGADGSAPSFPVLVGPGYGTYLTFAIAPDGRYAAVWLTDAGATMSEMRFRSIEPDGSVVTSHTVLVSDMRTGTLYNIEYDVHLAHDGTTWVLALRRSVPLSGGATFRSELTVRRGPTLAASRIVTSLTNPYDAPRPLRHPTLAIRSGEVIVSWQQRNASESGYHMRTQRHRVPALATDVLEASEPASVAMPAVTMHDTRWATVPTGDGVVHVWSDTRWGQAEAYAMPVVLAPCP